jgi:tetraacyldisaccharide 4'-kinase
MILSPFGKIYGAVANARNRLYERGFFRSYDLGAKTVSIGNITVGGTGKTPLAAFVAGTFFEAGEKVCILTRGYGRRDPRRRVLVSDGERVLTDARTAGDEPFELARKLSGKAVIVADADRVSAAEWAMEKFGPTVFVLDDAFQHRRVRRDLDIVCIDATDPFGNRQVLPAGVLREPLENLRRAGAIVITRANLAGDIEALKNELGKYANCPVFVSHNEFSGFTKLEDFHKNLDFEPHKLSTQYSALHTLPSLAFCALGNPRNFFEQLRGENFRVAAECSFPDHHVYAPKDIAALEAKARATGAEILLTTAKDAVKLGGLKTEIPVFIAENRIIFENRKDFVNYLLS